MKEFKVGERVTITLEAVEQGSCKGCFFCWAGACTYKGNTHYCCASFRIDNKPIIFKEVKVQKRNMKENKHSLKISRSFFGDTTLDGYPIATYSNDELKILKNLITKVLNEVNEYIKE
jgi:hypothetical protein